MVPPPNSSEAATPPTEGHMGGMQTHAHKRRERVVCSDREREDASQ